MDKRRILFITIFLITTLLLGFALYIVFFRGSTQVIPPTQEPQTPDGQAFPSAGVGQGGTTIPSEGGELPSTGQTGTTPGLLDRTPEARTQQLLQDQILQPQVTNNNQVNFYNREDGKFYRVDQSGNLTPLSDKVFFNVDTVSWSSQQNEAILEYPDGANIYYNFDNEKQVTLPKHWEDFSFSSEGNQIAAKSVGLSPENRWLIVSNPDGSNTRLIEPLGENGDKVTVDWSPNKQMLALSRTGEAAGGDREEVLLVGQHGENFQSLVVEGRGMVSNWSPTGDKLLYSVYNARNDFKPELWIVNSSPNNIGTGRQLLRVNTWADKCSFDSSNPRFVYCGVPTILETGAGFQPAIANTTPDSLYRIDTQTGIQTEIPFDDDVPHTIDSLSVSNNGKTIYFTDKQNDGLYQVNL